MYRSQSIVILKNKNALMILTLKVPIRAKRVNVAHQYLDVRVVGEQQLQAANIALSTGHMDRCPSMQFTINL